MTDETDDILTDLDYQIVPLDEAGSVRVHYRFASEIEPMPYDLDAGANNERRNRRNRRNPRRLRVC